MHETRDKIGQEFKTLVDSPTALSEASDLIAKLLGLYYVEMREGSKTAKLAS